MATKPSSGSKISNVVVSGKTAPNITKGSILGTVTYKKLIRDTGITQYPSASLNSWQNMEDTWSGFSAANNPGLKDGDLCYLDIYADNNVSAKFLLTYHSIDSSNVLHCYNMTWAKVGEDNYYIWENSEAMYVSNVSDSVAASSTSDPSLCTNTTLTRGTKATAANMYLLDKANISINADGGTGGGASASSYRPSNSDQLVTLTQPTKSGYDFNGWSLTGTYGAPTMSGNSFSIPHNMYYGNLSSKALWKKSFPDFTIALAGKTYWFCMPDTTTRYWGWYGTSCGTSTSSTNYAGASNTAAVLAKDVPTDKTPNIWQALLDYRTSTGYNDWFVPSQGELKYAKDHGAPSDWFSSAVWTSSESSSKNARYWSLTNERWDTGNKSSRFRVAFARSF